MRYSRSLPSLFAVLLSVTSACASRGGGQTAGPVRLNIPRDALPGPGLCRAWVSGRAVSRQPLPRGCDGIEHSAPLGSRVLYRPDDRSRTVHVRYMSTGEQGVIIGIDVFNIDNGRLVRVLQKFGEPER